MGIFQSQSRLPWFHQSQAGDFVFKCFGCLCHRAFGLEVWFARFDGGEIPPIQKHPKKWCLSWGQPLEIDSVPAQLSFGILSILWIFVKNEIVHVAQIWEIIMETRRKKHLPAQRRRIYLLLSAVPILLACMGYFFLEEIGPLNATTTMNDHNMHMMHMR